MQILNRTLLRQSQLFLYEHYFYTKELHIATGSTKKLHQKLFKDVSP